MYRILFEIKLKKKLFYALKNAKNNTLFVVVFPVFSVYFVFFSFGKNKKKIKQKNRKVSFLCSYVCFFCFFVCLDREFFQKNIYPVP